MEKLVLAAALAACAAGAGAQQQQRPQMQQRAPSAAQATAEDALSSGSARPLTAQQKAQAYTRALGVAKLDTGELGAPVRITPRDLYVNSTTYAWVKRGTVAPSVGSSGVSHIPRKPAGSGDAPMLEIHFRAAASKQYIVDCTLTRAARVKMGVGGPEIASVENHFVGALPATAQAREVRLQLVSDDGFEWTLCEIVPVNR